MPGFRRSRAAWMVIAVLLGLAVLAWALEPAPVPLLGHARAVDGDTIRVGGERVRLLGLDAPELAQTCADSAGKDWACGRAALELMRELLSKNGIVCAPRGHDRYGRVLARCTAEKVDLAAAVVRAGLAVADGDYGSEEGSARAAKLGIWSGSFTLPAEWRREQAGETAPSLGDVIASWFR